MKPYCEEIDGPIGPNQRKLLVGPAGQEPTTEVWVTVGDEGIRQAHREMLHPSLPLHLAQDVAGLERYLDQKLREAAVIRCIPPKWNPPRARRQKRKK